MAFDICPAATTVTQSFGDTTFALEWPAPWAAGGFFHAGIDLVGADIDRKPVFATRPGTIVAMDDPVHTIHIAGQTIEEPFLGPNAVCLMVTEQDRTVFIEYGHLASASVSAGQEVQAGDELGTVGTRGASTGAHLHVEVRTDGPHQQVRTDVRDAAIIDPEPYLTHAPGAVLATGVSHTGGESSMVIIPAPAAVNPARLDVFVIDANLNVARTFSDGGAHMAVINVDGSFAQGWTRINVDVSTS